MTKTVFFYVDNCEPAGEQDLWSLAVDENVAWAFYVCIFQGKHRIKTDRVDNGSMPTRTIFFDKIM